MQGQSIYLTLLDASLDVTAKLRIAAEAQRRFNTMLEQAAKQARLERQQARGDRPLARSEAQ